jgi:NAD(P) transhydrogenase subunit alpha
MMVRAFVPKETVPGETRVAAVPETVKGLVKAGLQVQVQSDAGTAAGFRDRDYTAAGAEIVGPGARGAADLVFAVQPPSPEQAAAHKAGAVLVCSLQPTLALPVVEALAKARVTTLALDLMPRITRAQKMDILSSQATVAGYMAVLLAASSLPKMFPLMMTAAGTITPARVLVLGAGVAGLQAIATARRLGAVVEANDIRPAVKEQVESLGARFVDTGTPPDAQTTTGYARETTAEYQKRQREILTEHLASADVVIATAQIPGRKAPVLITADMVKAMRQGAVIVDMAVSTGGNVEGSRPGERVQVNGVTILGETNLAALAAGDSSRMFARNILAFLPEFVKDGALKLDMENEVLAAVTVTHDGAVRHEGAKAALQKGN